MAKPSSLFLDELNITRTNFRVVDFLSWQRHGSLELRPPFQRGSVWSAKAKSFYIDTLIRGFPVPLIFIQDRTNRETLEPMRQVVDGQQRLRTVLAYVDLSCLKNSDPEESDKFTISRIHNPSLAGKGFQDLPDEYQQRILNFEFSVHVLPSATPNRVLLELFARMNATGTRLNEQEIRNAEFSGAFKQASYDLAFEYLDYWLDWKVFNKAQVARMKEVEMTSELLISIEKGVVAKSQSAISTFYEDHEEDYPTGEEAKRRFDLIMSRLDATYSESLNELYDGEGLVDTPFNTQGWFYVLFHFLYKQSYADLVGPGSGRARAKALDTTRLRRHLEKRAERLAAETDPDLIKALRGAATDRSSREARLKFLEEGWRS